MLGSTQTAVGTLDLSCAMDLNMTLRCSIPKKDAIYLHAGSKLDQLLLHVYLFMYVFLCVHCGGGHRMTCRGQFYHSTMWVSGIKQGGQACTANPFTPEPSL